MKRTSALLLAAAVLVPLPGRAAAWSPGPALYGVGVTKNVGVTMSDGTVIRVDVHFPTDRATGAAAPGPFPVILTQTPYGKTVGSYASGAIGGGVNPYLVERGYIHAVADIRGSGASGGTFGLFEREQATDGAALVRWAAALPRSSGSVGLLGLSYLGFIQLFTAAEVGPNSPLKAIFPIVAGNDPYRDVVFQGGIEAAEFGLPILGVFALADMGNPIIDRPNGPAGVVDTERRHAGTLASFQARLLTSILTGGDLAYEDEYWKTRSPNEILDRIVANGIPAFSVGGWYDLLQRGTPLNFAGMQNVWAGHPQNRPMSVEQPVTGRYQLLMGPWYHVSDYAGIDFNRLELRWFDNWLKNADTGIADTTTPVHVDELGASRWVDAARYPLEEATPTTYYLGAGGSLTAALPAAAGGEDRIVFGGASSPCSRTTEQWGYGAVADAAASAKTRNPCAEDDRTTRVGPGSLTYTTEPFAHDTSIAGPIDVSLYATSTRPDTELVARIEDVAPNGASNPITSGALLGSFRALDPVRTWTAADGKLLLPYHSYSRASVVPVTPELVTRFDIEVFPTFARLAAGHRLRLTITTGDSPHLLPTPPQLANLAGGVYLIRRNAAAASYLEIPLAPSAAFTRPCEICVP